MTDIDVQRRYGSARSPEKITIHGLLITVLGMDGAYIAKSFGKDYLTIGATFGEDIYSHRRVGMLNATKAATIALGPNAHAQPGLSPPVSVQLNQHVIQAAIATEVRSRNMDPSHRPNLDQPIMFVETEPGHLHLFGGTASVARFDPDYPPEVLAYVLSGEFVDCIRCHVYTRKRAGWALMPTRVMIKRV